MRDQHLRGCKSTKNGKKVQHLLKVLFSHRWRLVRSLARAALGVSIRVSALVLSLVTSQTVQTLKTVAVGPHHVP